jgi:hypothetical protein
MLTGRLKGICNGRPVQLHAHGAELSLQVDDFRSAWSLRRNLGVGTAPVLRMLRSNELRLHVKVGRRWRIEVLPVPGLVLRVLFPALRFFKA